MCPILRPRGRYSPWNSPGQNPGVGSLSLLQGIFPTQGLNPGLPHCRRILYQLSHQGSHTLTVSGQIFWLYCCAVVLYIVTTEGKPVQDRWDLSIVSYKCMGFYTYFQMKGVNLKRAAVYEYMQQHEWISEAFCGAREARPTMCDLMVFIWSSVRGGSAVVESQAVAAGRGRALTAETLENFLNGSVLLWLW